jgi:NAD(P)-dependent dehydrogenase (short-subunit alcohol dehydrogenase family)
MMNGDMGRVELTGRTVLVTGAAVRLGRAIALALAEAGADVVVHARHSAAAAGTLCAEIRGLGRRAWQVSGALETPTGAEDLFRQAVAAAGPIDGLVNNAAVFALSSLAQADAAAFEMAWRVNTLAPVMLTRALSAHVRARRLPTGRPVAGVVNLLDQRIARPGAGCLAYGVSKQALAAFTLGAARELAPDLTVNGVAPGAVLPPPAGTDRETAGAIPMGRRPTPEQVADAVVFLLGSPAITGQIVYVDGGQHLV